ncbi:hypothetical protein EYF80_066918 [Liparis tanakae]|uniref:Uncharacterized protein n=1 Tax=Liparis tanakae TaxID=230148 RepID=A0A4Z2E252_9TELE|nr:hypothetical protein EYF80_066918 [Liparis tanakae]
MSVQESDGEPLWPEPKIMNQMFTHIRHQEVRSPLHLMAGAWRRAESSRLTSPWGHDANRVLAQVELHGEESADGSDVMTTASSSCFHWYWEGTGPLGGGCWFSASGGGGDGSFGDHRTDTEVWQHGASLRRSEAVGIFS